jgi:hypothetical protein
MACHAAPEHISKRNGLLGAFFTQLFELLLAITGSQKFQKLVKPALRDLSYTTISYMQVSQSVSQRDSSSRGVAHNMHMCRTCSAPKTPLGT